MDNMQIYEATRAVPNEAKKTIGAGRLKGMTDINPMWRIKKLTEMFGPCGIGWYVKPISCDVYPAGDEIIVRKTVELYFKLNGQWSEPIPGEGGAKMLAKESKGLFADDEAFKKATTDAISVCCKMLGMGADVYWGKDNETKYSSARPEPSGPVCEECGQAIGPTVSKNGEFIPADRVIAIAKEKTGKQLCADCTKKAVANG